MAQHIMSARGSMPHHIVSRRGFTAQHVVSGRGFTAQHVCDWAWFHGPAHCVWEWFHASSILFLGVVSWSCTLSLGVVPHPSTCVWEWFHHAFSSLCLGVVSWSSKKRLHVVPCPSTLSYKSYLSLITGNNHIFSKILWIEISFRYFDERIKGLNFDIVIYREMFKKSSSKEPLGQFQPNFAGNMLGRWGIRFV